MSDPNDILLKQTTNERQQMSRAITVKVATPKVIKALETKLATLKKDKENEASNEAKFQKLNEKWKKDIIAFAIANIKKAENVRSNYQSWNNRLNIDFDILISELDMPKQPERDFVTMHDHTYREMVEEITNALSILKMTDEETVNASTMKQIARYL
jgi:predicted nucleic acid-binding protein